MSCDKDFGDINMNELQPTTVDFEAVFNTLTRSLQLGWNRQLFFHNEILYDVTELGVVTAKTFGNVDAGAQDIWSNYYEALKNARQLKTNLAAISASDTEADDIVSAQVDILMAYKTFQVMDFFGDIPYSEAARAFDNDNAILRPKYDDAKEIYLSLLQELRMASDFLLSVSDKTAAGNPYLRIGVEGDALFGDNKFSWIKFSNTMLLRYLVRIYDIEPELVGNEIENLILGGYEFINAGEEIVMSPDEQGWSNEGVNWSFREHNKLRLGTTMWNFMTDNGVIVDPRTNVFFETNNAEAWEPFPQIAPLGVRQSGGAPYDKDTRDKAYSNKGENNIYSSFNFYLVRDEKDIPEILFTAAEVKFLLAEVFLRGIGVPKDEFIASFRHQEGMLISMEYWQNLAIASTIWENQPPILNSGEIFQVTENPKYKFNIGAPEEENLAKIYAQRWVDSFRQPWEAFSLMRQTDLLPLEKTENEFYRFAYPVSESNFNFENWSNTTNAMGGDLNNIKLWWMK